MGAALALPLERQLSGRLSILAEEHPSPSPPTPIDADKDGRNFLSRNGTIASLVVGSVGLLLLLYVCYRGNWRATLSHLGISRVIFVRRRRQEASSTTMGVWAGECKAEPQTEHTISGADYPLSEPPSVPPSELSHGYLTDDSEPSFGPVCIPPPRCVSSRSSERREHSREQSPQLASQGWRLSS